MANVQRAGAGETTPGEEKVLQVLAGLPATWTVIANKILAINPTNSFEIDFIVIGLHRVTILDEKSYRRHITGTDEIWNLAGGDSISSPFGKIDMIARQLSSLLGRKVAGFPEKRSGVVPVVGGIILSDGSATTQVRDLRASRCLLTSANALDKLLWLDHEARDAGFDLTPIQNRIAITLYNDNSAHRPKRPSRIGLFSVDDKIDARDTCRVFLATNEAGASRTLYVYPHQSANGAATDALNRDLEALGLLQATGAVGAAAWELTPLHLRHARTHRSRPVSCIRMSVFVYSRWQHRRARMEWTGQGKITHHGCVLVVPKGPTPARRTENPGW